MNVHFSLKGDLHEYRFNGGWFRASVDANGATRLITLNAKTEFHSCDAKEFAKALRDTADELEKFAEGAFGERVKTRVEGEDQL